MQDKLYLDKLYPYRDSGFAILMIIFHILERYLRNKNGLSHKDNLNDGCMVELRNLFPMLPSNDGAWKFWNIFRNGILHQVTLSREKRSGQPLPEGWLSHDIDSAIQIETDGSFLIHPVYFGKTIIERINNDFITFEQGSAVATKLPKVKTHPTATSSRPIVVGTNTEM